MCGGSDRSPPPDFRSASFCLVAFIWGIIDSAGAAGWGVLMAFSPVRVT
jgi:hypothetical protein